MTSVAVRLIFTLDMFGRKHFIVKKKSRTLVRRPAEERPQAARRIPPVVVEEPLRPGDRRARGTLSPNP